MKDKGSDDSKEVTTGKRCDGEAVCFTCHGSTEIAGFFYLLIREDATLDHCSLVLCNDELCKGKWLRLQPYPFVQYIDGLKQWDSAGTGPSSYLQYR